MGVKVGGHLSQTSEQLSRFSTQELLDLYCAVDHYINTKEDRVNPESIRIDVVGRVTRLRKLRFRVREGLKVRGVRV